MVVLLELDPLDLLMSELLPIWPPQKIQKQGLTTVQKIIPSHSQCVKMAENMDLLMSQFLPFWPPPKKDRNQKDRTSKVNTVYYAVLYYEVVL